MHITVQVEKSASHIPCNCNWVSAECLSDERDNPWKRLVLYWKIRSDMKTVKGGGNNLKQSILRIRKRNDIRGNSGFGHKDICNSLDLGTSKKHSCSVLEAPPHKCTRLDGNQDWKANRNKWKMPKKKKMSEWQLCQSLCMECVYHSGACLPQLPVPALPGGTHSLSQSTRLPRYCWSLHSCDLSYFPCCWLCSECQTHSGPWWSPTPVCGEREDKLSVCILRGAQAHAGSCILDTWNRNGWKAWNQLRRGVANDAEWRSYSFQP